MYRRDFIKQSAALLAVSGLPTYVGPARRHEEAGRPHRHRVVRQVRPAAAGPGGAGRGGVALRRRQADGVGRRRAGGDAAGSRRSGRASTATTARCSRSATSTSCSSDTPDHWHALPMIEAVKSGVDVWVQKPISVDVVEGQAMLAAARKYKRVVQVGMQRRSTPHLVHARDRVIKEGKLGTIGLVEIYCYYHMRATQNPPDGPAAREPRLRDVDRSGADAAVQLARAPAQLARVHGIRQRDRGRHVRAHARHGALDAGPRHARRGSARRAASSSTRRARRTSPTRRPRRSNSPT